MFGCSQTCTFVKLYDVCTCQSYVERRHSETESNIQLVLFLCDEEITTRLRTPRPSINACWNSGQVDEQVHLRIDKSLEKMHSCFLRKCAPEKVDRSNIAAINLFGRKKNPNEGNSLIEICATWGYFHKAIAATEVGTTVATYIFPNKAFYI